MNKDDDEDPLPYVPLIEHSLVHFAPRKPEVSHKSHQLLVPTTT